LGHICLHCFVSGRVQGVFFRRYTYNQAVSKGLTGWVKNLEDGRVEVLICGEQETVEALREWLWQGSPTAKVSAVEAQEVALQEYTKFEIR
jgi:acylphosphatase